jgi:predicted ATP-grasp superfamily ATP-dependent carboligase
MANVLLVGPWGPLALAFARSLARRQIGVYLLQATAQHPDPWSYSSLRGATAIPEQLAGTAEGLDRIKRYAREVDATALAAVVDGELTWLSAHRDEFEPWCRVLIQPADSLIALLSKSYQLDLARKVGFSVLQTWSLGGPADVDAIPASQYPLALRPDREGDVHPGFKVRLVGSADELRALLGDCTRIGSPIVAQPFKRLPNLLVHGARSTAGDVIASRCYLVPRKFEGVSLAVEPRRFPDGLEETCRAFAERAGITGCYHFEFLFDPQENQAHFLEVNVRMGGTTDKVVQMGFDEPGLLLQCYGITNARIPAATGSSRRVVNKRVLLKHIVSAATGKLTALDYPPVGRLTHIAYSGRDLLLAKDSTFDWRDVPGSVRFQLRGLTSAR